MVLSKLLLKYKLADKHQISHAMAAQKKASQSGNPMPLGQILVAQGALSQDRLDYLIALERFMRVRQADRSFCAMAVKKGFLNSDKIEQAMQLQLAKFKKGGTIQRISQVLTENGILGQRAVAEINALLEAGRDMAGESDKAPASDMPLTGLQSEASLSSNVRCTAEPSAGDKRGGVNAGLYFRICVKDDMTEAFLTQVAKPPPEMKVTDLKMLIEGTGIKHGVTSNAELEAYLKNENPPPEWVFARCTPPKLPVDGKVEYFFDTDPIKVGTAKAGGKIDFRERGERPVVETDALLAKRTPSAKGSPGIDITGQPIPVDNPKEAKILVGAGVRINDTKTEAYAKVAGFPQLTSYGKLFVHEELVIQGDVNMETGNVNFEGSINVHGVVEDGFTIRGGNLSANEIRKANVEVTGDVVVFGGLVGARIISDGNVRARYVHGSTIHCAGDCVVEMLMVNSDIEASGAVLSKSGKILSSNVTARRGIEGGIIGSDKSKACRLRIGVDAKFEKKANALRETIEEKRKLREQTIEQIQSSNEDAHNLELKIGEWAQVQDRSMVEQRRAHNRIAELEAEDNFENDGEIRSLHAQMKSLLKRAKEAEEELEKLLDQQDLIKDEIAANSQPIKDLDAEIAQLNRELTDLTEWDASQPRDPVVKAHGQIMAGTEIQARFCATTLKTNANRVIIRETDTHANEDADRNAPRWQLSVVPLM